MTMSKCSNKEVPCEFESKKATILNATSLLFPSLLFSSLLFGYIQDLAAVPYLSRIVAKWSPQNRPIIDQNNVCARLAKYF